MQGNKMKKSIGVIRIRNSNDRQHKNQMEMDKQRSTKHYTEN